MAGGPRFDDIERRLEGTDPLDPQRAFLALRAEVAVLENVLETQSAQYPPAVLDVLAARLEALIMETRVLSMTWEEE